MHLEITLIFTTNFVCSLDIRASRESFPIAVRSPEITIPGGIANAGRQVNHCQSIRLTKILSEFNILSKAYRSGTDMITGGRPNADL